MRQFFIVGFRPEGMTKDALLLDDYELCGFNYLRMMEGKAIGALPDSLVLRVKNSDSEVARAQVIVNPLGWLVVSEDVSRRLSARLGGSIELLDVKVLDCVGKRVGKKYSVVNSLMRLEALSESDSVTAPSPFQGGRLIVKPCVIELNVPSDAHLFRLKGDMLRMIVDDVIVDCLNCDGLAFTPTMVK